MSRAFSFGMMWATKPSAVVPRRRNESFTYAVAVSLNALRKTPAFRACTGTTYPIITNTMVSRTTREFIGLQILYTFFISALD